MMSVPVMFGRRESVSPRWLKKEMPIFWGYYITHRFASLLHLHTLAGLPYMQMWSRPRFLSGPSRKLRLLSIPKNTQSMQRRDKNSVGILLLYCSRMTQIVPVPILFQVLYNFQILKWQFSLMTSSSQGTSSCNKSSVSYNRYESKWWCSLLAVLLFNFQPAIRLLFPPPYNLGRATTNVMLRNSEGFSLSFEFKSPKALGNSVLYSGTFKYRAPAVYNNRQHRIPSISSIYTNTGNKAIM